MCLIFILQKDTEIQEGANSPTPKIKAWKVKDARFAVQIIVKENYIHVKMSKQHSRNLKEKESCTFV